MQLTRIRLASVAVSFAAMSVSACGTVAAGDAGTIVAGAQADGTPAIPSADRDEPTPTPSASGTRAPLPDRANAASRKHPDPCGVDNNLDGIERENRFFEGPADRVVAAAKELFGGRYLGAYIANVQQQYGVGVGLYQLTTADEDAFFEATCFRRGDVVFEAGPVSGTQLAAWQAEAVEIISGDAGCSTDPDWQTGRITVIIKPGHTDVREALQRAIPADNLIVKEKECPESLLVIRSR
jgi:hypothetical protein